MKKYLGLLYDGETTSSHLIKAKSLEDAESKLEEYAKENGQVLSDILEL